MVSTLHTQLVSLLSNSSIYGERLRMCAKYEQYAHVAYVLCPFLMASSALDLLRRLFVFNDSMWCI